MVKTNLQVSSDLIFKQSVFHFNMMLVTLSWWYSGFLSVWVLYRRIVITMVKHWKFSVWNAREHIVNFLCSQWGLSCQMRSWKFSLHSALGRYWDVKSRTDFEQGSWNYFYGNVIAYYRVTSHLENNYSASAKWKCQQAWFELANLCSSLL